MSKPTNLGLWSTTGGTTIEPLLAQKQAGWQNAKKLPARWLNWWMNNAYLWTVWLDAFESTAHTWTALQSFSAGVAAGAADGSHGMIDSLGVNNAPAIYGQAGSGATGVGVVGQGTDRTTTGNSGVIGLGGAGTGTNGVGGFGGVYFGGAGGPGAGVGGGAVSGTGGAIDGTVNTTGAGGVAGTFAGGAITSDANGRRGGDAIKATGGLGQGGYGAAVHSPHGSIILDDGAISQTPLAGQVNGFAASIFNDTIEVQNTALFHGSITGTESVIAPTLGNSWVNSGGSDEVAGYWKDKFGNVHLQGTIKNGTANTAAFTLPAGYRPTHDRYYTVYFETATSASVFIIASSGDVKVNYAGSPPTRLSLDRIMFRP